MISCVMPGPKPLACVGVFWRNMSYAGWPRPGGGVRCLCANDVFSDAIGNCSGRKVPGVRPEGKVCDRLPSGNRMSKPPGVIQVLNQPGFCPVMLLGKLLISVQQVGHFQAIRAAISPLGPIFGLTPVYCSKFVPSMVVKLPRVSPHGAQTPSSTQYASVARPACSR